MDSLERRISEAGASRQVAAFHRAQDVSCSRSRVQPLSWETDSLFGAVYTPEPEPFPDGRARRLQPLLELAYGYQLRPDHPRGVARRAPSAGALYPIEVLLLLGGRDGEARAYYYSFAARALHVAHAIDAQRAARALDLGPGDAAVAAVASFWRTVQRYGVRGYRYCLLDGANVLANLVQVLARHGAAGRLELASAGGSLERALRLPRTVGLLQSVIVRDLERLDDAVGASAHVAAGLPRVTPARAECPPPLSPELQRVKAFHAQTLGALDRWPVQLAGARAPLARRSAKSFSPSPLPAKMHAELIRRVADRAHVVPGCADALVSYGIRLRVEGAPPGIERIPPGPGDGRNWKLGPSLAADALSSVLRELCQGQQLAGECAYAVVTGLDSARLEHVDAAAYRDLVLEVGYLGAELYAAAAELRIGTTTIGGFHDASLARLVGDESWCSITVQLFGEPASHGEKIDATSRVGTHRRGNDGKR